MSFRDFIASTWEENTLFSVLIELTYRCNLDCFYCYNDVNLQGKPLTLEEYDQFFRDLRDMQVFQLTFSGGEPLAHPHFLELGRRARELGFLLRIKSNGHALRGKLAQRLKDEVDPYVVEVSLHGATAAVHDRQTRVPGSFERLISNIQEMQHLDLRVKLNSTMTSWNEEEIEAMYALADRLGCPLQVTWSVSPRDNGDMTPLEISPSRAGIGSLLTISRSRSASRSELREGETEVHQLIALGAAKPSPATTATTKQCGTGSSSVTVDPYGEVYPCVQLRRSLGSLHEKSIQEIWSHSPELREVRSLAVEAKNLVDGFGPNGRSMGFCMGLAEMHTGSPLQVYPEARRHLQLSIDSDGAGILGGEDTQPKYRSVQK